MPKEPKQRLFDKINIEMNYLYMKQPLNPQNRMGKLIEALILQTTQEHEMSDCPTCSLACMRDKNCINLTSLKALSACGYNEASSILTYVDELARLEIGEKR